MKGVDCRGFFENFTHLPLFIYGRPEKEVLKRKSRKWRDVMAASMKFRCVAILTLLVALFSLVGSHLGRIYTRDDINKYRLCF